MLSSQLNHGRDKFKFPGQPFPDPTFSRSNIKVQFRFRVYDVNSKLNGQKPADTLIVYIDFSRHRAKIESNICASIHTSSLCGLNRKRCQLLFYCSILWDDITTFLRNRWEWYL